jgi:hypothetical protein
MNMFEKATKNRLRFESQKGLLSVEDLWGLSLTALDGIARKVNKEIREREEESFISICRVSGDNTLRLEILKYIINDKITERDEAKQNAIKEAQVAQLKHILAEKQSEELKNLSAEEIQKKIAEMSA